MNRLLARWLLLPLWGLTVSQLPAQTPQTPSDRPPEESSDQVKLQTKMGLFFPLEEKAGQITVSKTVWLNKNTVLEPGTKLSTLFTMPSLDDADVQAERKRIQSKRSLSSERQLPVEKSNALVEALRKRSEQPAWTTHIPFRAMLNRRDAGELYLVYYPPSGDKRIEPVDLPEDMLWIEESGAVTIEWVDETGGGAKFGFQHGDKVISINSIATPTIQALRQAYLDLRTDRGMGVGVVSVEVQRKGEADHLYLSLKTPPSLGGSALEMF